MRASDYQNIKEEAKTIEELRRAEKLLDVLHPCLKKCDKRFLTTFGSKTAIGLYRTIKTIMEEEC